MGLDFMTNLDYNVQADNLKCKQPEQNVEKSRSLVERARLEIVYTPQGYRGFESLLLRQIRTVILIQSVSGLRFLLFGKNGVFAALLHFPDFVYHGFERLASFCVAAKPEACRAKIKSRVNSQPKSCRIYI